MIKSKLTGNGLAICSCTHNDHVLDYLRIGSESSNLNLASCNGSVWVYNNGKKRLLILLLCGLSTYINA